MESHSPIGTEFPAFIQIDPLVDPGTNYRFHGETVVFSILLFLGLCANGPLLVIYLRSKHIRSIVDKFLFNMLIADALCVIVLIPTILTDLIFPEEGSNNLELAQYVMASRTDQQLNQIPVSVFSSNAPSPLSVTNLNLIESSVVILTSAATTRPSWACAFKKSLLSGVSTASILASLEIAVERYLAVVNPLHYHEFVTKSGVVLTSSIGSSIAIVSAILSSLDPCQPVFPGCIKNMSSVSDSLWWPAYTLVHVTLFFIVPIVLMTFVYIKIWWEAKRQRAKMSQQYKRPFFVDVENFERDAHQAAVEETKRGKRFYIHPLLLRFKLIERLVAPRMDRAARVAICTLCVTILCWGPYYFVETSHALMSLLEKRIGAKAWHHYETIIPLFFASLHPVIAPFFYAYRYKRVIEEALKTVGLDLCLHKKYCVGHVSPRRSSILDFHDTQLTASASKTNQILTPVSSEVGIHVPTHYETPPHSPKLPRFHIGPLLEVGEIPPSSHSVPSTGLEESQLSLTVSENLNSTAIKVLFSGISSWIGTHCPRWGRHRESVASNSSIMSLLSCRALVSSSPIPAIQISTPNPLSPV